MVGWYSEIFFRTDLPSTSASTSSPIRSRRTSDEPVEPVNIPAASAVAGGIAASYELPYMTPPINFSGDSQDSSSKRRYLTKSSRYSIKYGLQRVILV